MPSRFNKDPSEDLEYEFDFAGLTNGVPDATSDYLDAGETIISHDVEAEDGITLGETSSTKGNTCVQVWLSGGTLGEYYRVTATVLTSLDRTVERTMTIRLVNK